MALRNLGIALIIISIAIFWRMHNVEVSMNSKAQAEQPEQEPQSRRSKQTISPHAYPEAVSEHVNSLSETTAEPALTQFTNQIPAMGKCLGLNPELTGSTDLKTESLIDTIRTELGDPIARTEDWSNTELKLSSGEHRGIRIDTNFGDELVGRKLKYFNMNSDGSTSPIEIDKELTDDPTETLIASLEKSGEIVNRLSSTRIYFQNGEEFIVTEKNGILTDIEVNRNAKTFKCSNLTMAGSQCQCL